MRGGYAFVAEKEKAVIDCLYYKRNIVSFSDILNAIPECDIDKLVIYALRMDSSAVVQRLGYLLSLNNIPIPRSLKKRVGKNHVLLNVALPRKGEYVSEWNLIVNEAIQ